MHAITPRSAVVQGRALTPLTAPALSPAGDRVTRQASGTFALCGETSQARHPHRETGRRLPRGLRLATPSERFCDGTPEPMAIRSQNPIPTAQTAAGGCHAMTNRH